jgi:hypothetical protein
MTLSLPEAIADKIKEMNELIIPQYVAIIPDSPITALTVAQVVALMRGDVQRAVESLASGDVTEMLAAWEAIKEYKQ